MSVIPDGIRDDFPALAQEINGHPLVYFDNAATTQKPHAVLDAIQNYYEHDNANVHRGIHELSNRATAAYEGARDRVAQFINAPAREDIIFTRGTTEAINLVAATWGTANLGAGDVILLTELEHHSNLVPWQLLAQRTGAKLRFIPVTGDEGTLDLSDFDGQLEGVKLVSLTHISNALGTINPVAEICAQAKVVGVVTLVDAAQSAGHMPLDVQALGCDFLALSGHKLCGPTGVGALFARRELQEAMPPYQGGGEMISKVEFHKSEFNVPPHKFEAGTPNVAGAAGLHAALDYLDAIGLDAIHAHDTELAHYAKERLNEFEGVRIFGPTEERGSLVSFIFENVHALDLATLADQQGVAIRIGHHCTQPLHEKLGVPATARASFYFYNTRSEVDRFIEVLQKVIKLLK
ncbi:MAG: cysteine desulfurase [Verrucomicrobiales bacterium]|jgi:cysteine desulfurase / selenocysteine lyase|nr:cysteine desulfurase [Verrucomicrobiales bacterium]MBT5846797.1 cysteine desulfurase [Verrucomicrobiales bacterium]